MHLDWLLVCQAMRARATRPRSKRASGGRPPSGAGRKRAALGAFASHPEPAGGGAAGGADDCGASKGAAGGGSSALEAAAAGAGAAASGDGGGGSSGEDASESSGGRKVRWAAGLLRVYQDVSFAGSGT